MIKGTSNSGAPRAPKPKHVRVFNGIKGLIASGPGMTKKVDHLVLRPEPNQDAKIPSPPSTSSPKPGQALMQTAGGTATERIARRGSITTSDVASGINPEPMMTPRDACGVLKPFAK